LPWVLAALVVAFGAIWLLGRGRREAARHATPVTEPARPTPAAPTGQAVESLTAGTRAAGLSQAITRGPPVAPAFPAPRPRVRHRFGGSPARQHGRARRGGRSPRGASYGRHPRRGP